jgi:hypothetical protein
MNANLPDDFDHALFEARYGSPLHESLSANTHAAAAMVSLAATCGRDWSEASDWLDDCLANDKPRRRGESWTNAARAELDALYDGDVKLCIEVVAAHAAAEKYERDQRAAKREAISFSADLQVTAA